VSVALRSLGEVCKTTSGGTPSRSKPHYFEGTIPWVKSGELPDGIVVQNSEYISDEAISNSSAKLLPAGTLLVALYGATVGKLGILSRPAATNQAVCAIFPSDAINTKFLFWYLLAKRPWLIGQAAGGAQPNISQGVVRSLLVPVMPLAAQHEIVAGIEKQFSRLDEAVANLQRVKANLKRYKASVLKDAVEGRLVPTEAELARREGRSFETGELLLQRILGERKNLWSGRGKYKSPISVDSALQESQPEGWASVSWETILAPEDGSFKRGPFGSALTKAIFVHSGFKVYEQYCPINDDCSFARYYITREKFEALKGFAVRAGDYLISCSGVTLGRITRVPEKFDPGVINQALLRVRLNPTVIDHGYFLHLFRGPLFQTQIFEQSAGAAIPNVRGVAELKAMPMPLPPLPEQRRIADEVERRLSLIRSVETEVDVNIKRAQALRQSTLSKAFVGDKQS